MLELVRLIYQRDTRTALKIFLVIGMTECLPRETNLRTVLRNMAGCVLKGHVYRNAATKKIWRETVIIPRQLRSRPIAPGPWIHRVWGSRPSYSTTTTTTTATIYGRDLLIVTFQVRPSGHVPM